MMTFKDKLLKNSPRIILIRMLHKLMPQKLEWDIGSYWNYTIEDQFSAAYEIIGSRERLVNDIQRPYHVVVVYTARNEGSSHYQSELETYQSFFDIEVTDVTKDELGLVTDNEIEMILTMRPDKSQYTQSFSDSDEEGYRSITQFLGKETVEIDGMKYVDCDKIVLEESEDKRTYWYSEIIQNHVKISSADGTFLMELHDSGRNEYSIDSLYLRLTDMSKSHERKQILRCIHALIELGDIISFTRRSDLLLELSRSDDWYVVEKAAAALEELSR